MTSGYQVLFLQFIILYLSLLIMGAIVAYIIFILFKRSPPFFSIDSRKAIRILFIAIIIYIAVFSTFCLVRYNLLIPRTYDMGNMEQTVWNTAHGDLFRMTTFYPAESRLYYHVEPIFLILAPLYLFWQDGRFLLLIQTVILALGAIPVFLIAREKLKDNFAALSLGIVYLLFPAIHQANAVDFHPLSLGTTFILFAFYWFLKDKYFLSFSFFSLAIFCREEYAAMVFLFGLYFIIARRKWRFGALLSIFGLGWFLFVLLYIIPTFSPSDSVMQFGIYAHLGGSPTEIINNIIDDPGGFLGLLVSTSRVSYLLYLLAPLCLLPFLGLGLLATGLFSFLTIYLRMESSIHAGLMHNHSSLVGPIFLAAIFGIYFIAKRFKNRSPTVIKYLTFQILVVTVFTVAALQFTVVSPLREIDVKFSPHQRTVIREAIQKIPQDASVLTVASLGARLARRADLYSFHELLNYTVVNPDYVFTTDYLDSYCPSWAEGSDSCLDKEGIYKSIVLSLQQDTNYQTIIEDDDIYLFQRK